ncbi:MAG: glycosyltransferase [Bacillota bacterium]|nr:glycosyltransferase [Bacillota bacterium]
MYKFSFVILHFKNLKDTIKCIQSIMETILYSNYNIVIVDNGSNDGSGEYLKKLYKDRNYINVIIKSENLGFAKGNNIGYKFAKYDLNADFICLLNNDIIIAQVNFIEKCIELYESKKYFVIGPDVISLVDNNHQNPHGLHVATKKSVMKTMIKCLIMLIATYLPFYNFLLKRLKNRKTIRSDHYMNEMEGVVLHGSCLVFSMKFIQISDGLFDKTFMYGEEEILLYLCIKGNMKILYSPELFIYHNEGASTMHVLSGSINRKRRFYFRNKIKSSYEFLKLMLFSNTYI